MTWDESGWPVFNGGQPLSEHLPDVLHDKSPIVSYNNDFTSPTLDPSFYFIRTPYKPFHSLSARPGYLTLNANSYAPGDRDSAALILRKQTSYEEIFETELDFTPKTNLTEAGISIYYGELLHNEIAVLGAATSGERQIVIRTIVQAMQVGPWALVLTNSTITTVSSVLHLVHLLTFLYLSSLWHYLDQVHPTFYKIRPDQAKDTRELNFVCAGILRGGRK